MDVTILDVVEGRAARVNSTGRLHVIADLAGQSGSLEVRPVSSSTVDHDEVEIDDTGTQILAGQDRHGVMLANKDDENTVWLSFGGAAATTESFPLRPGQQWSLPAGVTTDQSI